LGTFVWPNSQIRYSYAAEILFFKDWIMRRMTWMDSQWLVPVTGNHEIPLSGVSIYPNPFTEILHICLPPDETGSSIEIVDLRGVRVFSQQQHLQSGEFSLNLHGLKDGIYLLMISREGKATEVKKILKSTF
jgi:hypothetical protein